MEIVQKMHPAAEFILGEGNPDASAIYRRASFCVVTECGGTKVAYNTLTKELVELNAVEAKALCADSIGYKDGLCGLVRSRFLVPVGSDDEKLCDGVTRFAKSAAPKGKITNFTVFTTTDCNARCFYCYEQGIKHTYMSRDGAERTAEFIAESCGGCDVSITWYGGEPLMNTAAIDTVTALLAEKGVRFKSSVATNGSLFDKPLIERAISLWCTEKVQITLDGTEEVYERIKAYKSGRGKFSRVLDNIDALLCGGVLVNIRINLDGHNIDDAKALVDLLAGRFGCRKGLNVYTALLFDNCSGAKRSLTPYDRTALAKAAVEIEDYAAKRGILHPRRLYYSVSHSFCKADNGAAIVITADGNFVKCDFYTDSNFAGNLWDGIDGERAAASLAEFSERVKCKGCSAYPICLRPAACPTGGCDAARRLVTEERLVRSVRRLYSSLKEKSDV